MRIDTGHLRRHIRTHAQRAPGELIDQLEGLQGKIGAGAGQQRVDVFKKRRDNQLVTAHAEQIEHSPAQTLDLSRLMGKRISNIFG